MPSERGEDRRTFSRKSESDEGCIVRAEDVRAFFRNGGGSGRLDATSVRSSYDAAKAALVQAEDAYRRMEELHAKGSLPEIKWVEVQSKLQQARSMEEMARKNLKDCKLYAPFSGVIADKSVEVG